MIFGRSRMPSLMRPPMRSLCGAALATMALLAVLPASADQAAPAAHTSRAEPLKKGALFTQSRAQLLKDGWRPLNVHAGEDYEYMGTESALIKAKILEVESCAMDRALCIFHYQKAKRCLRVVTYGEEVPTMTIESWDVTCPEPRRPNDK